MKWGFPISISVLFWSIVGLFRFLFDETRKADRPNLSDKEFEREKAKVAILVPAHNEAAVITATIISLKRLVPEKQIYVVCDGCTDSTAALAKKTGANVLELNPGKGKAGALENVMKHFKLLTTNSKVEYIMIADADTVFSDNFLRVGLPYFKNKKIMAFTGFAKTRWDKTPLISTKRLFIGYRTRLYNTLQIVLMWGQTWRFTNVNPVIPGFASIYRRQALKKLKLDVPGLAIEDFNMAFQLHKKKLGLHAHHPSAVAVCQDPDNLKDYWKQIRRWNLGFFQTARHYGIWTSFFWLSLAIFSIEVFISSLFFLILPVTTYFVITGQYSEFILGNSFLDSFIDPEISLYIIYATLVIDYLFTWTVAFLDNKPSLFFYGFFFFIIRYIDAIVLLITLPQGLITKSSGRWTSPTRRK